MRKDELADLLDRCEHDLYEQGQRVEWEEGARSAIALIRIRAKLVDKNGRRCV